MFKQMIALDAVSCLQAQHIVRPEFVKEKIRSSAASAVARHAGFAAVRVEDANTEIRVTISRALRDRDSIRAGAVVTITDATRKPAEIGYVSEMLRFENDVVVPEALKFGEPWRHVWSVADAALRFLCGLATWREIPALAKTQRRKVSRRLQNLRRGFAKGLSEALRQSRLDAEQPLVNR